ncbi:cell division protein FtsQ/DivIB [Marinitenerispora sediminis]|uniref:Cell division protein FtsQ n=1 Tax=Marinitenerispora sediminis TaxID=1931232 RepID=A0A368T5E5_9ACTN|nr:FtsQ-type POTRA domain-containing protein [Marinitenerispora sediminis]RCV54494.1 cell division protein FtsQ [Marinitenerispora sediminis]RCV58921.1 cell division protein FtsQ [Marinitenerispora sediminis]RCV61358.1 cell division protein FtsQ [Marinitenerispora sediminis]
MREADTETGAPATAPAAEGARGGSGRPRRSDPWKAAFVALLVVAVLAVAAWLLLGSRLLVVRDVEVTGTQRVGRDEVLTAADVPTGTALARVDTEAVRERVADLRLVESVEVSRSWPATLRVRVTERAPALSVAVGEGYRLVDGDGVTVEDVAERPADYPLVDVRGEITGNPGIAEAAAIVAELPADVLERIGRIDATDRAAVILLLDDGAEVVWGDGERTAEKARLLDILMREHPPTEERRYDVSAPDVAVVE